MGWFAASADTLRAVLGNLVDNVRQHAGPAARYRINGMMDGGMVALEVTDDGRGISAGNAARVFDRFFTTARAQGGTGLGLTIVRSLLEAAGGSVVLVPEGPGARFLLRLPLAPQAS